MSTQAMNQLLKTLEGLGYISRSTVPDESGVRIVRFTQTRARRLQENGGHSQGYRTRMEHGAGALRRFAQLKALLGALWDSLLVR
jgi:hypothetical protein